MLVYFPSFSSCSFWGANLGEAVLMTVGSKKYERYGNTAKIGTIPHAECYLITIGSLSVANVN